MKLIIFFTHFVFTVLCYKGEIEVTENVTISFVTKSIKCVVKDPRIELHICNIKPISRTVKHLNLGGELKNDLFGPQLEVNHTTIKANSKFLHFLFQYEFLVEYQFGTIYRQIVRKKFNYCQLCKNGKFIYTGPVFRLLYNLIKDYLPAFLLQGCPVKKGVRILLIRKFDKVNNYGFFRFIKSQTIQLQHHSFFLSAI